MCDHSGADLVYLEKGTRDANCAERAIETLKQDTKRDRHKFNMSEIVLCYALVRRAKINNATVRDNIHCQGQTPETIMTGQPINISHISEFKFYEWVKYKRENVQYPFSSWKLGRCLGPATNQGSGMCQHVMTDKGNDENPDITKIITNGS